MSKRSRKPLPKIRDRIKNSPVDTNLFGTYKHASFYYAMVCEAASCWQRVLRFTMTQDRMHERVERIRKVIEQKLRDHNDPLYLQLEEETN